MKALLIYPKYPDTFWSFKHALKFISKKAGLPPLGLLTVAAMLPEKWEKRFVDINVSKLKDKDLKWPDYVFISAMSIQKGSVKEIISRCKSLGIKVVAGGPLFTASHEEFDDVDHLVLNEAEVTMPAFLEDLSSGYAKHLYTSEEFPGIGESPVPLWGLINMKKYYSMNIQYSRGCPFNCEFCDITTLFGHKVRTKTKTQILKELDNLYCRGWRGNVFFVDDNFIGHKEKLKRELLPAIIKWMEKKKHPFCFYTETSINLSDDSELMQLMVEAGFDTVFVGIESPNEESLVECNKMQNKGRDLIACIKKIQKYGLQVQGGFIVGFDNDPPLIFERLISFIQESSIVTAMVGLLSAPRGSNLYKRLVKEGRLLEEASGNNCDLQINFIPKMNREVLVNGYKRIIRTIYSPKHYYRRVKDFLKEFKPLRKKVFYLNKNYLGAFLKSIFFLGIVGKERVHYWKLFFWSLFRRPRLFSMAITFSIFG
ncbi:MAG: DUF4070 domain-containing protein, partial [Candidatus Auribacterota bacterium]|nr:DUF4070 domain-containing protein [Candidatus Auribacterota bacterium]